MGAVSEMEKLDHTFEKNFIGFQNCSTGEYVQLVRLGNDSWYADVPIKDQKNWEGYLWAGYGNTKSITDMLKLFFEEVSWFDSIPWKMRRCITMTKCPQCGKSSSCTNFLGLPWRKY